MRSLTGDPYLSRAHTSPIQKHRLCKFALGHIIKAEGIDKHCPSFVLGPGSSMVVLFQHLTSRLDPTTRFVVVSNQFEILETYLSHEAPLRNWSLFFYGERPDLHHHSLTPRDGEDLGPLFRRAETQFAIISCKHITKSKDSIEIGAFGPEHAAALKQIVDKCPGQIYVLADDSKRCSTPQHGGRDIFARLSSSDPSAQRFTFILSAGGRPGAFTGWDVVCTAIDKWMEKPRLACFISFCDEDTNVANQLYIDLKAEDVDCWKWDEDGPPGERSSSAIYEAMDTHPPVVAVCSVKAFASEFVREEINYAVRNPRNHDDPVLVGYLLDDCLETPEACPTEIRNVRGRVAQANCIRGDKIEYLVAREQIYGALDERAGKRLTCR